LRYWLYSETVGVDFYYLWTCWFRVRSTIKIFARLFSGMLTDSWK
jgi:hypothetical protein